MNPTMRFEAVCRAMSDPGFYPHAVSRLEVKETHISTVFLTGDWVYKLKKPKNLGFLDFRDLSDRKHFCMREVVLNQRLSSGIYKEVACIYEDGDSNLSLRPSGMVVEYAVKMVQLPEDSNFAVLLHKGGIPHDQIIALGAILADFYTNAERGAHIDAFGDPEHIRYNMEENFEQIQPFVKNRMDTEKWEFVCQVCRSFWENHVELFKYRVRSGRIRDGHGDLRCDHIYFDESIQIIDCIEFNERFRYGDAALDLAFLIMDLDRLGHSGIGQRLLSVYAEKSGDPEIYALLDFYAAYRALVRLKVACFSLEQADPRPQATLLFDIGCYLRQAYQYAVSFGRPTLWIFFGLPASGKSTLAEKVAGALFMPLFQSDRVRKLDPDFSGETVVPFNTGMYQPALRGRVYAKLLNLGQEELKKGKSVALDATFSDAKWRQSAIQLAQDQNVSLIFVQCRCESETIRTRLAQREATSGVSDARLIHFEDMLRHFDPVELEMPNILVVIDTDHAVEQSLYETLAKAYSLKHAQVATLLRILGDVA